MTPLAIFILIVAIFGICIVAGGWLLEKFWDWYDDAVWDEQEEDRPEPDDFPDSK